LQVEFDQEFPLNGVRLTFYIVILVAAVGPGGIRNTGAYPGREFISLAREALSTK
jgi:hypothetical protein